MFVWGHHVTGHVTLQGLCHAVRKEAWKFLLGYFPWESTTEERKVLQRSKTYDWHILNIYYTLLALHYFCSKCNIWDEQVIMSYVWVDRMSWLMLCLCVWLQWWVLQDEAAVEVCQWGTREEKLPSERLQESDRWAMLSSNYFISSAV